MRAEITCGTTGHRAGSAASCAGAGACRRGEPRPSAGSQGRRCRQGRCGRSHGRPSTTAGEARNRPSAIGATNARRTRRTREHQTHVMVVATAVGARAHANDPTRERHLVVDLAERGRHLVCERATNDHDVGLTGRGTEDDTEPVLVVPRGGDVPVVRGKEGQQLSN